MQDAKRNGMFINAHSSGYGMNWLVNGLLGLLFYGAFGVANKYASGIDSYAANLLVQTTFMIGALLVLVIARKKLRWSGDALLAGLLGSIGTWIVLVALAKNQLIVVYPFVALSSIVFIAANTIVYKARYAGRKLAFLLAGLCLSCIGVFFAAVGGSGGFTSFLTTMRLDAVFLLEGIGVMVAWGLLAFFWMRARVVRSFDEYTTLFWSGIGSLGVAVAMLAWHPEGLTQLHLQAAPIIGGAALVVASLFMLKAFGMTKTTSSIKNVVLSFLTNGEIIPVTIFALVVLREYSLEGIVGVCVSVVGVLLLSVADAAQ